MMALHDKIRWDQRAAAIAEAWPIPLREQALERIALLHNRAREEIAAWNQAGREGEHTWPARTSVETVVRGLYTAPRLEVTTPRRYGATKTTVVTVAFSVGRDGQLYERTL